jgi:glycosyltransferase involved in cell wall biosynthesis
MPDPAHGGRPYLSVIIPAYNEEKRLPPTLRRVTEFLSGWGRRYEVIVIDDGSKDGTIAAARAMGLPHVTVSPNERNRGKGFSVRRGMLLAKENAASFRTPIFRRRSRRWTGSCRSSIRGRTS